MGVNQDFGSYAYRYDSGDVWFVLTDDYINNGIASGSVKVNPEDFIILADATLRVSVDDFVVDEFSFSDYTETDYYIEWMATLQAGQQLKIELLNVAAADINFNEFDLEQTNAGGVIFDERFNGEFSELWYQNDLGTDFSSNPGALSYSVYDGGGNGAEYFLEAAFDPVDIETNPVFMNTYVYGMPAESGLQVHTNEGWIPVNIAYAPRNGTGAFLLRDALDDPDNPAPPGFDGNIDGIGIRMIFPVY